MKENIIYWARFTAVAAATAALTATLLNMGVAVAGDLSREIIGKPSIHNKVMDELTGQVTVRATMEDRDAVKAGKEDSGSGAIPTSMLWPADKYIPQFGKTA